MTTERKRVLSGIQPTGEAHLGNYLGAIQNWVSLLDRYDCLYCIVDLHAITLEYDPALLPERVFDLAVSLIASGLHPDRCTLFVQSDVPEHTELTWFLTTVTPLGDLYRMTQFKDKSGGMESVGAGLLNYPILQAADILAYRPALVPVGEDQRQHLELTREIARRWNGRFGEYLPEPQPLIGEARRVRGLDGVSKMSKSKDNVIPLIAEGDDLWNLVRTAVTDPARVRKDDPGNPHVCNVFALHEFFTDADRRREIEIRCQTANIGCVDCKRILADGIERTTAPIRARAEELRARPDRVYEALGDGAERARRIAGETLAEVRERMGIGVRVESAVAGAG